MVSNCQEIIVYILKDQIGLHTIRRSGIAKASSVMQVPCVNNKPVCLISYNSQCRGNIFESDVQRGILGVGQGMLVLEAFSKKLTYRSTFKLSALLRMPLTNDL